MASILRVPVTWTGLTGLPGVSVFYWDGGVLSDLSDLVDFFDTIKTRFPTGLTWTIPSSGDSISDSTGALDGTYAGLNGGTVAATGGAVAYAAGVGARVRWRTGGIRNGRRVVGSTFLAPISNNGYETNGTLSSAYLTDFTTAATALVATGALLTWSRPEPGGSDGASHAVTGFEIPDRVTALRSRRY